MPGLDGGEGQLGHDPDEGPGGVHDEGDEEENQVMRRRRGDEEDGELRGCREQPVRGNPDQPSVEASPSVFTMYNCWIVQYIDR